VGGVALHSPVNVAGWLNGVLQSKDVAHGAGGDLECALRAGLGVNPQVGIAVEYYVSGGALLCTG